MAIQEAVLTAIQKCLCNVIIESDSQLEIRAIIGDVKALSQISNIIKDIRIVTKAVRNLKFIIVIDMLISLLIGLLERPSNVPLKKLRYIILFSLYICVLEGIDLVNEKSFALMKK